MPAFTRLPQAAGGRAALAAHAARIPTETDPRWLEVLDANGLVPSLPPDRRLAWALWQVAQPEPGRVMAGQARLVELARTSPEVLVARPAAPGPAEGPLLRRARRRAAQTGGSAPANGSRWARGRCRSVAHRPTAARETAVPSTQVPAHPQRP